MTGRVFRWLNIYEEEVSLFLWTLALLFVVRSSGILLNNYAETAFLKRYGVEFLPVVNMLNAVVTVITMGFMAGLIQRYPGPGLLGGLFVFCGGSVVAIRALIPLGIELVYPILFMLKAQYEVLLALLFWNLANDLFNTRQSKRLFPLITAGGVIGQILASFGTPWMVRVLAFDNLLIVYLAVTLAGAGVVGGMKARFPSLLMGEARSPAAKARRSMLEEVRNVWPLMKESMLLRLMIVLTFMPNVVIPILNYQFNYAVDGRFASEFSMVEFFSYFRGVLNIINLFLLLFVGKVYGRWGLPVALMFHPFNYVLAFLSLLLRFDIFSAMYARMSANVIRTTINIPANAILMGLFPASYRGLVRPFLRGTVVRGALFLGSGLILISARLFHPRYLSLVALPFVLCWLAGPFLLKRRYGAILLDLIARNQLDLKSLEQEEVAPIFRDRNIQRQLVDAFRKSHGRAAIWYAGLLHRLEHPDLETCLLQRMGEFDEAEQRQMLELIDARAGSRVVPVLTRLAAQGGTELKIATLQAVNRLAPDVGAGFVLEEYLDHTVCEIRGHALGGLLRRRPELYRETTQAWLAAPDLEAKTAGLIAVRASADPTFEPQLRAVIQDASSAQLLPEAIRALHAVGGADPQGILPPLLQHPDRCVRQAAVRAFHVTDNRGLTTLLPLLGDSDEGVRDAAMDRIGAAEYQDGKTLIEALNIPNKKLREGLFTLLDRLQIRDVDIFRFARGQLEGAYKSLAETEGAQSLPETPGRELLLAHLVEQRRQIVENVLRVLEIQDTRGSMRTICRGVVSQDGRQRANSQEALDDLLDHSLSRILLPLLEDVTPERALPAGRKHFRLPDYRDHPSALLGHLLTRSDWVAVLLGLRIAGELPAVPVQSQAVRQLTNHARPHVRQLACHIVNRDSNAAAGRYTMANDLTLPDIILRLRAIEIFAGLTVSELAAVASIAEEAVFPEQEVVLKEGDAGDTLYLLLEGEVSVNKRQENGENLELDRIGEGDYFGEMALFENIPRTATIRTERLSRMLVIHKREFKEMIREYPQIPLAICSVLSGRIRKLHQKILHSETTASPLT